MNISGRILQLAALASLAAFGPRTQAEAVPNLTPPARIIQPASVLGSHIQRTMTLLATSTPEHRNRVRILFYGQSITENVWWRETEDDLRRRFPNALLEVENRAIGGFASNLLIKPAEHDVPAYYPDLVIFHVYGDHRKYEEIIRLIRSRTTSEVLIQNDHQTRWAAKTGVPKDGGEVWDDRMNRDIIPEIASKFGCGLVDIRSSWTAYLEDNHLQPRDLLVDDVHLNPRGYSLMAAIVNSYLVYRPDLPREEWQSLVRTFEVGSGVSWEKGRLTLHFEGNRIDAIAQRTAVKSEGLGHSARVLIDGKKPSEIEGTHSITRPSPRPWSALALIRVDHDRPLLAEDWTLTITSFDPSPAKWSFRVEGSKTGSDGSGWSDAAFTSPSGRVRIDPGSWFQKMPVEPGYRIRWSVVPMFTDVYREAVSDDPSVELSTILAQGLPNGPHTLELVAEPGQTLELAALRAFRPPFATTVFPTLLVASGTTTLVVAFGSILAIRRARARRGRRQEVAT